MGVEFKRLLPKSRQEVTMWEFIKHSLGSGVVAAVLLSIAGYLGRAQLAHWLNRDIEQIKARHQHDLEAKKAEYQRDLESYRTQLIAQNEAARATLDVRKAMALKVAERRFEGISRLHAAFTGLASDHCVAIDLIQGDSSYRIAGVVERSTEFSEALSLAAVFFDSKQMLAMNAFRLHMADSIAALKSSATSADEFMRVRNAIRLGHASVATVVELALNEMLQMAEPSR